jgi:hypothetical protein
LEAEATGEVKAVYEKRNPGSDAMEKLYVNEKCPDGEVSTVGLFYSRGEAENIVAQLRSLPEKADCRYEIIEAVAGFPLTNPPKTHESRGRKLSLNRESATAKKSF